MSLNFLTPQLKWASDHAPCTWGTPPSSPSFIHQTIGPSQPPRPQTLNHFSPLNPSNPQPGILILTPEPSILNRFLFPAPPPSYGWDSFPGELICIASRDGVIIPCTVRALLAPPYSESWCHSRHGINAEDTREHAKSSPRLPFFAWDEPSNHKPKNLHRRPDLSWDELKVVVPAHIGGRRR